MKKSSGKRAVNNRKAFIYFRDVVPRNLSDVKLIPPYDQVVLDNAFTKIDQWSINLLRDAVLEADDTYKKSQFSLRRCTSDMTLGVLPCARFMLAALGMLTVQHAAAGVSLLLNSGVLALTQVSRVKRYFNIFYKSDSCSKILTLGRNWSMVDAMFLVI